MSEFDLSGDTSADYGFDGSDSFSLGSENVSATGPSGDSGGTDSQFFGGSDFNTMDFGRGSVSNVINAANYDPNFAALGMIGRGLTPNMDLRNQISFDVPPSMLPQVPGDLIMNEAGDRQMYYSEAEKFLQETAPEIVRGFQSVGIGSLINRLGTGISEAFSDAKRAIGLDGGAQGGLKTSDFTGMMSTRDDRSSGTMQMSDMSQEGAGISVTDPVVTTPNVTMGTIPRVSPTFDAFGNVTRDANMSRLADQFGQINAGIASVAPNMARDANIQVADASQLLNPQAISQGLNYLAGPQIQEFFRGVTNNPNTTIRLGPGFDMNKQKADDNIFSINIPFSTG